MLRPEAGEKSSGRGKEEGQRTERKSGDLLPLAFCVFPLFLSGAELHVAKPAFQHWGWNESSVRGLHWFSCCGLMGLTGGAKSGWVL
jgi:hypothetical protein